VSVIEQTSHGASRTGDAELRAQNQWCSLGLQQHQGNIMTRKNPKKKFFRPKKPVDTMTEQELEEFAKFVFDNLMGDTQDEDERDDTSH
jgi:hypothetical protein